MINLHALKTTAGGMLAVVAALGWQAPLAMAADNPFNPALSSANYTLAAADGQGKCGGGMKREKDGCKMMRMDSNGDGQVSREEFMKGHEAMFEKMDSNGDGMLTVEEKRAHKAMMKQEMMGKCGQQKGAQ